MGSEPGSASGTRTRRDRIDGRFLRLRIRVLFYVVVVLAILLVRFVPSLRPNLPHPRLPNLEAKGFVLTGCALAPALTAKLLIDYRERYPGVEITLQPGGTAQALEALINRKSDVAFLTRRPSADEQRLFRATLGDTLSVFPVALGGIVLVAPAATGIAALSVDQFRRFLTRGGVAPFERLYAPDPNLGLWDAATELLGQTAAPGDSARWPGVIFLADEAAVFDATSRDPRSLGLASTLALPEDPGALGLRVVSIQGSLETAAPSAIGVSEGDVAGLRKGDGSSEGDAASPGQEEIASGDYPLYHYLYVSCRPDGGIQGSMFVTYLYSGRGQRLVKRSGFIPAREVAREVILTTNPIGKTN